MFSVATNGRPTSESTPTIGGAAGPGVGLRARRRRPGTDQRPAEQRRGDPGRCAQTASDINDPQLGWPSGPGWDLQFGYGRPNAFEAMKAISEGDDPAGRLDRRAGLVLALRPDATASVPVRGHVEARRSKARYRWKLEFAPGRRAGRRRLRHGRLGQAAHELDGRLGQDRPDEASRSRSGRRAFTALDDEDARDQRAVHRHAAAARHRRAGPRRRGPAHDRRPSRPLAAAGLPATHRPGGESQPALADLQGTRPPGDRVRRRRRPRPRASTAPAAGSCPGGPATTRHAGAAQAPRDRSGPRADRQQRRRRRPDRQRQACRSSRPRRRAHVRLQQPAASAAGLAEDHRRRACQQPPIPRPALDYTRPAGQGATASPVLARPRRRRRARDRPGGLGRPPARVARRRQPTSRAGRSR